MRYKYAVKFFVISAFILFCMYRSGLVAAEIEKEYWDNGNVRTAKQYNQAGNVAEVDYYREDGSLEQKERYDPAGHKVEESYYNSNGGLRANSDGWAAMRWKYKDGNLFTVSYYGSDGQLKERKIYNDLGDLVDKQYIGDPDLPAEEFNPVPPLAGETVQYYNSSGKPEGTTSVEYDDWI